MVSKEGDSLTIARKDVRQSVIVTSALIMVGMTVVSTPHSWEMSLVSGPHTF